MKAEFNINIEKLANNIVRSYFIKPVQAMDQYNVCFFQ